MRGYGYQEITPSDADGNALGGRYLRHGVRRSPHQNHRYHRFCAFVGAGSVTDSTFPDFSDVRIGAGVGVRYATPFGPIRLDVAVPLNKYPNRTDYGIYAGIGQSFQHDRAPEMVSARLQIEAGGARMGTLVRIIGRLVRLIVYAIVAVLVLAIGAVLVVGFVPSATKYRRRPGAQGLPRHGIT